MCTLQLLESHPRKLLVTAAEYKATRERLGTQAEVAPMLGVNRVTVAKRENGTMTITNEAVLAIQSLRRPMRVCKSENVKDQATRGA